MKTTNNNVAVEPFKQATTDKKEVRGLDMSDRLTNVLIATKVLFDSSKYKSGTTVYFRSDAVNIVQARTKFKVNDLEFVLMPEDQVMVFDERV